MGEKKKRKSKEDETKERDEKSKNSESKVFNQNFKKGFLEILDRFKERHSLKQNELAELLEIHPSKVSRIMDLKSSNLPDIKFLINLKEKFGDEIDLDYWLMQKQKSGVTRSKLFNSKIKTASDNDFHYDLKPDEYMYIQENKNQLKNLNDFLRKKEETHGRIYISNVFPSGLLRDGKDDADTIRKEHLNKGSIKISEYYTLSSLLNFSFGIFGDRIYTIEEKLSIFKKVPICFPYESRNKLIYFLDTSKKEKEKNKMEDRFSHFYGFSSCRLTGEDYLITTDPFRTLRIERNKKRFEEIKEDLESPNLDKISQGQDLVKVIELAWKELDESKVKNGDMNRLALNIFLKKLKLQQPKIHAMCLNNISPMYKSSHS